jgi:hypothetical protein
VEIRKPGSHYRAGHTISIQINTISPGATPPGNPFGIKNILSLQKQSKFNNKETHGNFNLTKCYSAWIKRTM